MVLIKFIKWLSLFFVVFMVLFVIIILLLIYSEITVVNYVSRHPWLALAGDVLRHASQLLFFTLTGIPPGDNIPALLLISLFVYRLPDAVSAFFSDKTFYLSCYVIYGAVFDSGYLLLSRYSETVV
ncbi:hypothetical protein [Rahnella variigena]|uniref:hypothetical protein n=1 Tax=Rahnella variigena TaxID=574964 RepID=UPI00244AB352|nr:hypothetical protein [Rahnella variigena]MDH2898280.1 hypothetical protein [Rahnella variigena]